MSVADKLGLKMTKKQQKRLALRMKCSTTGVGACVIPTTPIFVTPNVLTNDVSMN